MQLHSILHRNIFSANERMMVINAAGERRNKGAISKCSHRFYLLNTCIFLGRARARVRADREANAAQREKADCEQFNKQKATEWSRGRKENANRMR